jgi:hypothetical protein
MPADTGSNSGTLTNTLEEKPYYEPYYEPSHDPTKVSPEINSIANVVAQVAPTLNSTVHRFEIAPGAGTDNIIEFKIVAHISSKRKHPSSGFDNAQITKIAAGKAKKVVAHSTEVSKKQVTSADGAEMYIPGYNHSLHKFYNDVVDRRVSQGKSKNESERYAKDRCTRITMGVTSVISAELDDNKQFTMSLKDVMSMSAEKISTYCSRFHTGRVQGENTNVYTDITGAFKVYTEIMMV